MKDHTIYETTEAQTLAGIEDSMLRDTADRYCRKMAVAESLENLVSAYIEASSWMIAIEGSANELIRRRISAIIEAVCNRARISFAIDTREIAVA
jgi:hypothetical protein